MPGMDGIQATKIIKEKYQDSIRIVILSAFDDNIDRKRAKEAGADCFLNKPLTISKLYNQFVTMHDEPWKKLRKIINFLSKKNQKF